MAGRTGSRGPNGPRSVPDPDPQPGDDLGAAAAAGLDGAGGDPVVDNEHGQATIQAVWRAQFLGMSYDSPSDDVPKMDEHRTFLVTGTVVGENRKRMKDGELRTIRQFQITDVQPAPEGA